MRSTGCEAALPNAKPCRKQICLIVIFLRTHRKKGDSKDLWNLCRKHRYRNVSSWIRNTILFLVWSLEKSHIYLNPYWNRRQNILTRVTSLKTPLYTAKIRFSRVFIIILNCSKHRLLVLFKTAQARLILIIIGAKIRKYHNVSPVKCHFMAMKKRLCFSLIC